jgi:hypothetical protein
MRRGSGHTVQVRAALSATAVAGVMVLGPWAVVPAVAAPAGPVAAQVGPVSSTGVGEALVPMFGIGKSTITVEPQPGTFPADAPPNLDGLTLEITDVTAGFTQPCTLSASAPGPATCSTPLPVGDQMSVQLPADQVPTGYLPPAPLTFSIPDCSPDSQTPAICPASETMQLPGTWRPVGLEVTNAATGQPVAGADYQLCAPATTSSGGCPVGTVGIASGTSDAQGTLRFPGVFQGSLDYQVVATSVPAPYLSASPQPLDVPEVTTLAETGTAFTGKTTLTPKPPVAHDDTATMAQNTSRQVDPLVNDNTPVGSVRLQGITQPAHGKATTGSDGTVTYTPADGFVGTDRFGYTAVNEYGGTAHGTVTLAITDVAPTLAPVHLGTDENTSVSFDALARASAPTGNTLQVSAVGSPRHGSARIGDGGKVTYTPDHDYVGRDSFSYTEADNHGGTATARVTVSVARVVTPTPASHHHSSDQSGAPTGHHPNAHTGSAAAPAQTESELPDTGAPVGPGTMGTGGLLIALGALLLGWSRRRTKQA